MLTISNKGWLFTSILSALMAFTSLSTDIYLPAMPEMGRDLNGDAELTLTGFLIGFALAQLFWGAVSDKIGRKKPLIIGIVLFIIGSVGCALSSSMMELLAWRVFQAFGACVGPMLSRAMIRDLYGRTEAAKNVVYIGYRYGYSAYSRPNVSRTFTCMVYMAFYILVACWYRAFNARCRISASGNTSRREEEQKVHRSYL